MYLAVDLNPPRIENKGQIICLEFEPMTIKGIVADNFLDWMMIYVNKLESGDYVYSDDCEGIISIDYI